MRAYHIKLRFSNLRKYKSPYFAELYLKKLCSWMLKSRLPPMEKVAKTIKEHWGWILNYFKARITNGMIESINGRIQNIKREAWGFKTIEHFQTLIYIDLAILCWPFH